MTVCVFYDLTWLSLLGVGIKSWYIIILFIVFPLLHLFHCLASRFPSAPVSFSCIVFPLLHLFHFLASCFHFTLMPSEPREQNLRAHRDRHSREGPRLADEGTGSVPTTLRRVRLGRGWHHDCPTGPPGNVWWTTKFFLQFKKKIQQTCSDPYSNTLIILYLNFKVYIYFNKYITI